MPERRIAPAERASRQATEQFVLVARRHLLAERLLVLFSLRRRSGKGGARLRESSSGCPRTRGRAMLHSPLSGTVEAVTSLCASGAYDVKTSGGSKRTWGRRQSPPPTGQRTTKRISLRQADGRGVAVRRDREHTRGRVRRERVGAPARRRRGNGGHERTGHLVLTVGHLRG